MAYKEDINHNNICLHETGKVAVSAHILSLDSDGAKFSMDNSLC